MLRPSKVIFAFFPFSPMAVGVGDSIELSKKKKKKALFTKQQQKKETAMAAQTKMIIITTDEDIIRQFSLQKSTNTKIINLEDDSEQILSQNNDDDVVNLPFLAELSKLVRTLLSRYSTKPFVFLFFFRQNSTSDQVYKRALDSDDHLSSKPVKTSRRSIDMTCAICGDKAIGYNYDVLSCASCKAFFRRNAFKNLDKLRCLSHQGQCSVTHDTRRKCQRCRLERCFTVGMRKDFIISEEEKQRKKSVLEQNRTMTTLAQTEDELDRVCPLTQEKPKFYLVSFCL